MFARKIRPSRVAPALLILPALIVLLSCGDDDGPSRDAGTDADAGDAEAPIDAGPAMLPADWSDDVRAPVAEDVNDDPSIVEVNIEARVATVEYTPGVTTDVWTYNGSIPGPTIEANVGDTVIVHLTNSLPQETITHWHGLEVPAVMDGSHISQAAIAPGETFTYEFEVLTAAMYWYHPHFRSNEQVEKGLYGLLIVRDPEEDAALGIPENEIALALDDVLLDDSGQVADPFPADPVERAAMQINGREGNTFLVNGKVMPTLRVVSGIPVRMRLVDAANVRFFRVSIPGHTFHRIGTDAGLRSRATSHEPIGQVPRPGVEGETMSDPNEELGILLTPGERADVVFTPVGEPGDEMFLEWHDFRRGLHRLFRQPDDSIGMEHDHSDGKRAPVQIMRILFVDGGNSTDTVWEPPDTLREITAIPPPDAAVPPLTITLGHGMPDSATGDVMFFASLVDGMPKPFAMLGPDEGLEATVGETRMWEVSNLTMGHHNFHPHGFFFQPVEIEYVDMDNPENNRVVPFDVLENRDTIRIPARPGAMGRSRTILRLVTRFDDTGREGQVEAFGKSPTATSSGGWLAHCHILEHAGRGMMTFLNLREP